MGSGSSVLPKDEIVRTHRKSVRQKFNKEFGVSFESNEGKVEGVIPKIEIEEATVKDDSMALPELLGGETSKQKPKINAAVFRAKKLFMRPIMKNRLAKDKLVVKKQDNPGLLKEMFARMDPSLNNNASMRQIVGEVEVAIKFKPQDSILLIKVGRGRGLSKEEWSLSPDPFVAVDIFSTKDESDVITQTTKVKRKSCNPIFQEILAFPMTQKQISSIKLRIAMWDKVSKTLDDFLGENVLSLCKLDLIAGNVIWYKLHPKRDISFSGHLDVCVTFNEPKDLIVTINNASGVKICDKDEEVSNPYARLFVTGLPNKYQTSVRYGTLEPAWFENFQFDVYPSEFSRRVIVINLLSKDKVGGRDHNLGSVHIPLADFNYNHNGVSKEYALVDLRNASYSKSAWSEQGITLEFSEAMKAHLIYGYPMFLFKKHDKGKKMISCQSKQAQTQVKMILRNGIVSEEMVNM